MVIVKNLWNGTGPPERNRSARTEQVRQLRPKSSNNFTDRKIDPVKLLRSEYWKFIGILYEKNVRTTFLSCFSFFKFPQKNIIYLKKLSKNNKKFIPPRNRTRGLRAATSSAINCAINISVRESGSVILDSNSYLGTRDLS